MMNLFLMLLFFKVALFRVFIVCKLTKFKQNKCLAIMHFNHKIILDYFFQVKFTNEFASVHETLTIFFMHYSSYCGYITAVIDSLRWMYPTLGNEAVIITR